MVYSNKFVMSVFVNNVLQQELANGLVKVPFNSEYTLRFRNRNNRRAKVEFFIDGENVSGSGYIVSANDFIDIKRHANVDKAFKFVSLESNEAAEFGKNGPNTDKIKGVIEARFYLEKEYVAPPKVEHIHHHHYDNEPYYNGPFRQPFPYNPPKRWHVQNSVGLNSTSFEKSQQDLRSQHSLKKMRSHGSGQSQNSVRTQGFESTLESTLDCQPMFSASASGDNQTSFTSASLREGCTVEGRVTGQSFTTQYFNSETDFVTVKCFLQGYDPLVTEPKQPVTINEAKQAERLHTDLETENAELRRKIAELENESLKEKLDKLLNK